MRPGQDSKVEIADGRRIKRRRVQPVLLGGDVGARRFALELEVPIGFDQVRNAVAPAGVRLGSALLDGVRDFGPLLDARASVDECMHGSASSIVAPSGLSSGWCSLCSRNCRSWAPDSFIASPELPSCIVSRYTRWVRRRDEEDP